MLLPATRPRVAGSALTTTHFLLLYAAMLVAAAGNTALQSVMPAIGREIGISDFWVTVSYTWSAVLWVTLAPFWARKSDTHGRKNLTLLGVGGFITSMILCGLVLLAGLSDAGGCSLSSERVGRKDADDVRVLGQGCGNELGCFGGVVVAVLHAKVLECRVTFRAFLEPCDPGIGC